MPPDDQPPIEGLTLTFDNLYTATWRTYGRNWWRVTAATLVTTLVLVGFAIALASVLAIAISPFPSLQNGWWQRTPFFYGIHPLALAIAYLLNAATASPILAGLTLHIADIAASRETRISSIFRVFKSNWARTATVAFTWQILYHIAWAPLMWLLASPSISRGPVSFAIFLGVSLTGLYLVFFTVFRLLPSVLLAADGHTRTILGSFLISARLTKGHLRSLALSYTALPMFTMLTVFLLIVGAFVIGYPVLAAGVGAGYAIFRRDKIEPAYSS